MVLAPLLLTPGQRGDSMLPHLGKGTLASLPMLLEWHPVLWESLLVITSQGHSYWVEWNTSQPPQGFPGLSKSHPLLLWISTLHSLTCLVQKHLLSTCCVQPFQPFRRCHRVKELTVMTQVSGGSLRTRGTIMHRANIVKRFKIAEASSTGHCGLKGEDLLESRNSWGDNG